MDGITYDTAAHSVEVTVVDNHNGTLTATAKYDNADSLTITNTYAAQGETVLKATKSINDWGSADHFEFTLEALNGAPMPEGAVNGKISKNATKDNLTAVFGTIKYTEAGTYSYTITETDDGVDGITYDTAAHSVEVTVVDKEHTTLHQSVYNI